MHEHPQSGARDLIVETRHAIAGDVKTIGHPVKFSKTPAKVAKAAPVLGQHSREVLEQLGYDEETVARLVESGAVIAAEPADRPG